MLIEERFFEENWRDAQDYVMVFLLFGRGFTSEGRRFLMKLWLAVIFLLMTRRAFLGPVLGEDF